MTVQKTNRFFVWMMSLLLGVVFTAKAQTKIQLENHGAAVDAYWYAARPVGQDAVKAPAIVVLHGCGGMMQRKDQPNVRTANYAKLLNAQGWHVLFVDSLSRRGVQSICTDMPKVTYSQRVSDVQTALAYLAQRSDVDAQRLAVLGFSHGGTTALLSSDERVIYAARPRAFVALYPACTPVIDQGESWRPGYAVAMHLGAADDWTSPVPCQKLAAQWPAWLQQTTYAQAHHGFDSEGVGLKAVRLRMTHGEKVVHTGGNPAAKQAAQTQLVTFFKEHFK